MIPNAVFPYSRNKIFLDLGTPAPYTFDLFSVPDKYSLGRRLGDGQRQSEVVQ
jgi:hypothetical protein